LNKFSSAFWTVFSKLFPYQAGNQVQIQVLRGSNQSYPQATPLLYLAKPAFRAYQKVTKTMTKNKGQSKVTAMLCFHHEKN